jgi:hypothetical protein
MATNSNPNDKDVLYVDIDDDITTVIDKLRTSEAKVVALVLPKRASVFQSVVNMKLLKRNAESVKKHVVLVTTEPSLMPLAGSVGLYVAATPQSKPEIPLTIPINTAAEATAEEEPVSIDEPTTEKGFTAENAGDKPVGELASSEENVPTPLEGIETLTLPDEEEPEDDSSAAADGKKKKLAKDKSLKVPNFNKFRLWLLLAIIVVLVIIGLFFVLSFLPKAKIDITTNTSNVNTSLTLTLSTSAQSVNLSTLTIPARAEQQQKTTSQQVSTSGQQNNGVAATGSVTMTAEEGCNGTLFLPPGNVPAGTGVSANGLTYITQQNTAFGPGKYNPQDNCNDFKATTATSPTPITAQNPGTKYNTSGSVTFTVAGRSDIAATGSASGGTDVIVQVVAQADIDSAQQKLAAQNTSAVKSALEQQLTQDGLYPIPVTFSANTPSITSSSNVGSQATTVTVTQSVTYTMYGAMKSELDALIANNVDGQINTANQTITNDGLSGGTFGVVSSASGNEQVSLLATAVVGPKISAANIKKEVAGKRSGDAQTFIRQLPGVTSAKVYLSPFWVGSVPTNPGKVTVIISKAH